MMFFLLAYFHEFYFICNSVISFLLFYKHTFKTKQVYKIKVKYWENMFLDDIQRISSMITLMKQYENDDLICIPAFAALAGFSLKRDADKLRQNVQIKKSKRDYVLPLLPRIWKLKNHTRF